MKMQELFDTGNEWACSGTLVEYQGMFGERFVGMVVRVLNNGRLLEIEPSGMPTTFRTRIEDVIRIL